jgi:hypothetical protein
LENKKRKTNNKVLHIWLSMGFVRKVTAKTFSKEGLRNMFLCATCHFGTFGSHLSETIFVAFAVVCQFGCQKIFISSTVRPGLPDGLFSNRKSQFW